MKKVLLVFLGLVLLSQVVKFWERGHPVPSATRHVPARTHPARPATSGVYRT